MWKFFVWFTVLGWLAIEAYRFSITVCDTGLLIGGCGLERYILFGGIVFTGYLYFVGVTFFSLLAHTAWRRIPLTTYIIIGEFSLLIPLLFAHLFAFILDI